MKQSASKKASKPEGFECTFCGHRFKHEKRLVNHLCRKKKRFLERDRHDVRLGFIAYQMFYNLNYARTKAVDTEHFRDSSVYDAFVRFGKYIIDVNAIDPQEFIRHAVTSKKPIDTWTSGDRLYSDYVRVLNRFESFDRALERTVVLAESWANKNGGEIKNFLREVSPGQAVQWLLSGKISPWVLFNCESGKELLHKLSDEQMSLVENAIDFHFWTNKFKNSMEDVTVAQEFLKSEGL